MQISSIKKMNKRGQFSTFSIFTIGIMAFIAIVLFGGLIYVTGLLNNVFTQVGQQNEVNAGKPGYTNLTYASQSTFGQLNNSIVGLRLVGFCLIFAEIMAFIIFSAFQRVHPVMFFVYCLIVFLAVMLAAPISNAYEALLGTSIYDGGLQAFTGSNWILLHLPLVVLFTGLAGGMFMFINILRNSGEQTGL